MSSRTEDDELTLEQKEILVKENSLSNAARKARTKGKEGAVLASPQASNWSLEVADLQDLVDSPEQLDEAKPFLKPALYRELLREQKAVLGNDKGDKTSDNGTEWAQALLYAPELVEVDRNSLFRANIIYPPDFTIAINHNAKKAANLAFFHPNNFDILIQEFPHAKTKKPASLAQSDKKPAILDLDDLLRKLGVDLADDMEGLTTPLRCFDTMDQLLAFAATINSKGKKGPHFTFMSDHCCFFRFKDNSEEYYRWWKPFKRKLRQEHFLKGYKFNAVHYELQWSNMVNRAESDTHGDARFNARMGKFNKEFSGKRKSYSGWDDGDTSRQGGRKPFPSGNRGTLDIYCLGCAVWGHTTKTHSSSGLSSKTSSYTILPRTNLSVGSSTSTVIPKTKTVNVLTVLPNMSVHTVENLTTMRRSVLLKENPTTVSEWLESARPPRLVYIDFSSTIHHHSHSSSTSPEHLNLFH
ncbi:hypothetical protein AAF712_004669 [Marasmius tenuissimus]|uniref:Uncharacterized protein n=1 Tax=Marasmius tenuissimus TaxID=585030 RepID=A0ABR3A2S1_9AGAR